MTSPRTQAVDRRPRHSGFPRGGARVAAFATDLDRTLLRPGGHPSPAAREALRRARARGLRTLLVSGRRYEELVRFARGYPGLDGLVAENGAVIEAPRGRRPTVIGRATGALVQRRIRAVRGLGGVFGRVVASVGREKEPLLLRAVDRLPVRIVPNVDNLMVLPRGVTKRSGTRVALRQLGVGGRGYVAIGDAENDLDLLRGARFSAAVSNAEPSVRRLVDYVCREEFEAGVLEFVTGPLADLVNGGAVSARRTPRGRRATARGPRTGAG
jgi:phosphoglycolate phosphatase